MPSDTKQVPEYLAHRLGKAYERFLNAAPEIIASAIFGRNFFTFGLSRMIGSTYQ
jgi:hypothetical protein